jgi:hypothetical protein
MDSLDVVEELVDTQPEVSLPKIVEESVSAPQPKAIVDTQPETSAKKPEINKPQFVPKKPQVILKKPEVIPKKPQINKPEVIPKKEEQKPAAGAKKGQQESKPAQTRNQKRQ